MYRRERQRMAKEGRKILLEMFPECFVGKGVDKKPLKLGIAADIRALNIMSSAMVGLALGDYCSGASYHAAIALRRPRVDLHGNQVGFPDPKAASHALAALRRFPEHVQIQWYGAPVESGESDCAA